MSNVHSNTELPHTRNTENKKGSDMKKKWLAIGYAALVLAFAAGFWLSDRSPSSAMQAQETSK